MYLSEIQKNLLDYNKLQKKKMYLLEQQNVGINLDTWKQVVNINIIHKKHFFIFYLDKINAPIHIRGLTSHKQNIFDNLIGLIKKYIFLCQNVIYPEFG